MPQPCAGACECLHGQHRYLSPPNIIPHTLCLRHILHDLSGVWMNDEPWQVITALLLATPSLRTYPFHLVYVSEAYIRSLSCRSHCGIHIVYAIMAPSPAPPFQHLHPLVPSLSAPLLYLILERCSSLCESSLVLSHLIS